MINNEDLLATVLRQLKNCPPGSALVVLTFKGDRSLTIRKTADDCYSIDEKGFAIAHYDNLTPDKLKKQLRTLAKKEFPRSHKLRTRLITPDREN